MEYRKSEEQVKRIVDIIKPYLISKGLNLNAENDASRYSKINKKYKEYGEDFFINDTNSDESVYQTRYLKVKKNY